MSERNVFLTPGPSENGPPRADEGGLHAPPGLSPLGKFWWWFHFAVLVKLARYAGEQPNGSESVNLACHFSTGGSIMARRCVLFVKPAVLVAAAFLLVAPEVQAQDARGYRSTEWPWNMRAYQGMVPPSRPPATPPPPPSTAPSPQRYTIHVTVLPPKNKEAQDTALVVAHLPEDARIWFEDEPTKQTGSLRQFVSPSLTPGKRYTYRVRVQWFEDGRWVSQVHSFPVHAGDVHCIDVIPTESRAVEKAVAENLAKLAPDDRKAAQAQRFCAVQEGIRLGSMGVPVKVTVKGQPVYLCCEGCEAKAKADPDRALEKVRKSKAKKPGSSSP
jgi:uncharacterized protein (TIGR03000 family)